MAIVDREKTGSGWLGQLEPLQLDKGKVPETLISTLYNRVKGLLEAFNGQISLGDGTVYGWCGNLDAQEIEVVSDPVANTEFEVPHGLGRLPIGYDVTRRSSAGVIYDNGNGNWGVDKIHLRCSAAAMTFRLRLF